MFAWNAPPAPRATPLEPKKPGTDPLRLARYYQSLLDTGKFESRAASARFLGVSRARVTQVLNRLENTLPADSCYVGYLTSTIPRELVLANRGEPTYRKSALILWLKVADVKKLVFDQGPCVMEREAMSEMADYYGGPC